MIFYYKCKYKMPLFFKVYSIIFITFIHLCANCSIPRRYHLADLEAQNSRRHMFSTTSNNWNYCSEVSHGAEQVIDGCVKIRPSIYMSCSRSECLRLIKAGQRSKRDPVVRGCVHCIIFKKFKFINYPSKFHQTNHNTTFWAKGSCLATTCTVVGWAAGLIHTFFLLALW